MADPTPQEDVGGEDAPSDKGDKQLLDEAFENFKLCEDAWDPNRKSWLEDAKFAYQLEQWPEPVKKAREQDGQPCLTVDKINQYRRQIINDGRQNRPAVKVRPVDDQGDDEVAEAYQGIIRHICDRSNADEAYDTALDHAVTGGFGFIRVCTDYAHDKTFDQEIEVRRVRNAMAILLDPNIQMADGSDARFGFVIDEIPQSEFKRQFPQAKYTDWKTDAKKYSEGWTKGENIRIAEYWYKVDVPVTLHLMPDGTSIEDGDYQLAVKALGEQGIAPPKPIDTREVSGCEVRWCRLSGAEVLEKKEWLGKYIPIVPVFGNESDIEGKVSYSGLVRAAKDAQRLYNYSRSAYASRVALTPKAPWLIAEGQIEGHEDDWKNANKGTVAALVYKETSVDGHQVPPPDRVNPSDVPAGFAQDMQLAEHDIQSSMGMYAASVGQPSNEKSGRAIMARQREGDTATFHYMDNLNRAIRHLGRILVDLIPHYYGSRKVVRILGEDGEAEAAQTVTQGPPVQKMGSSTIYNLNVGQYDVSISSGPSYTTKREEQVDAMTELLKGNPALMQLIGDLYIRAQDWPNAEQIADRLKLMLPPQIAQAEQGQHAMPPEIQQAMQQLQQGQQELQQQHQQLQQMAQQLAQEQAATDAQKAKLEAMAKEVDAKDKILQANFQELSAKLELQAMKAAQMVPQVMPPGKDEPAIAPDSQQQPPQAPPGAFFTPGASQ